MAFNLMQTISFIYLLVITCTCSASLSHHDEECLALLEFKQSVSHQPHERSADVGGFQKLDSWRKISSNASDHDSDCCLWDGVVCSNHGHVIELDLSRSYLYGPIKSNSSLFNLVHLQTLNLSMNNFVGSQIPSEIARLNQLKSLDLSNSSFTGQIPIEVSHLLQLTLLDLSWNRLMLHSPSFGHLLQNFTRLEALHLSGVDISSFIPPFLANFSSLKSIDLEYCMLRDEFPSSIFNLPKLKFLNMANNPMLTGFLPEFHNNTILEHLNLFATSFAGSIPESIGKLNHLVFLSLLDSYFSGCIPRSLSNITQLTYLSLGQSLNVRLVPLLPGRFKLPVGLEVCERGRIDLNWIGKLTNLESLILVRINMNHEIPTLSCNLTKLSVVVMQACLISGHIPSSWMNHTQLRVIVLEYNQLEGQISRSFSSFKNLEVLRIASNKFSGKLDENIFLELTKLRILILDFNRLSFVTTNNHTNGPLLPKLDVLGLSSCNLKEFPSFLRHQKNLSVLSLAFNQIEGLVPEWILKNTKETLEFLDLSYNSITGFQGHPHFLPWVRLKRLNINYNQLQGYLPIPPPSVRLYDVSNNNFVGEIPPLICEVKSLRILDLSYNNMSGELPPCLGNLSNSLVCLDLKRNNFHGPMMNAFTHGSLIEYIDLSENKFTGQVSKSLANCTNLGNLILGGNSFHDMFPFWLGTLPNLQILSLRSNKFHGAIQGLGLPFHKLRIMDLSINGFSGQVPEKFFQTWNAMKSSKDRRSYVIGEEVFSNPTVSVSAPYSITITNKGVKREYNYHVLEIFRSIDLSCNNFEGHIPQSLGDLHGLESLNISNNHFTGHILPFFKNLKNLECLDLSRNELSGKIPQELLQLGFLEIFNVSFNHLQGIIPQGKQFNTFDNNSYIGNPDLCGEPLYKKCQSSKASSLPSINNESESLLPNDRIDWIIISIGVVSGLVIGIVLGNFLY